MKHKHYMIYCRNEERIDFFDDEETDHYLEYDNLKDLLIVTKNTGNKEIPVTKVAYFFQPIRVIFDFVL